MNNQEQYLSIGKVAKILGVAVVTLRRWEKLGKLNARFRTFGNHRRYFKSDIAKLLKINDKKVEIQSKINDKKDAIQAKSKKLLGICADVSDEEKLNQLNTTVDQLTVTITQLIEKRNAEAKMAKAKQAEAKAAKKTESKPAKQAEKKAEPKTAKQAEPKAEKKVESKATTQSEPKTNKKAEPKAAKQADPKTNTKK